jgi:hypothetical protein
METHTQLKPETVRSRTEMAFLLSGSRLRGSIRAAAVHTNTAGRTMHSKLTAWRFNNQ